MVSASDYNGALDATDQLEREATNRFGQESRCYAAALSEHAVALQLRKPWHRGPAVRLNERSRFFASILSYQDPKFALALNNAGVNLFWLRSYAEAARLHEEALELRRRLQPPDPAAVAESLHNLADAYRYLNRPPEEVKKLYEEALNIKMSLNARDDVSIAQTRQNLASAEELLKQFKDASDNLEQAIQIYRRNLKPDDIRIAAVLNRQGILYFRIGDYKQAELKFDEALRLERRSASTQLATLAATLDDFALNQIQLGRYDQAKSFAKEALAIRRSLFPGTHPTIARTLSNLSYLAWLKGNTDEALSLAREASQITIANGKIDEVSKFRLQRHLLVLWSTMAAGGISQTASQALAEEAFSIGQQAVRSDTAATVARTAIRFSAKEPHLRNLLKEADDLDRSSGALEQALTHSLTVVSQPSTESFSKIRSELTLLVDHRRSVLAEIRKSFPEYSELVDPKPLSAKAVQGLIEPNEALIVFVAGFEDVYVWCLTQENVSWRKLELSPQQLGKKHCIRFGQASMLSLKIRASQKNSLFNLGLANTLYNQLIGPISKQLGSKTKLLVVPSGPLIGLPLQLLVSNRPQIPAPTRDQPQAFKAADWLIKRFAISVIPSVESVEDLRRRAKPTPDRKPLIGFANPLPSPEFVSPGNKKLASEASMTSRGARGSRGLPEAVGELHDIAALRRFLAENPLESSGPELKDIGQVLGADPADLYIGVRATETQLKNKQAELASYRVVLFCDARLRRRNL